MKIHISSGSGIKNPVDHFGTEIKVGDVLSYDGWGHLSDGDNLLLRPYVIVKQGVDYLYGEGVDDVVESFRGSIGKPKSYLHDFRFKYTKKIDT